MKCNVCTLDSIHPTSPHPHAKNIREVTCGHPAGCGLRAQGEFSAGHASRVHPGTWRSGPPGLGCKVTPRPCVSSHVRLRCPDGAGAHLGAQAGCDPCTACHRQLGDICQRARGRQPAWGGSPASPRGPSPGGCRCSQDLGSSQLWANRQLDAGCSSPASGAAERDCASRPCSPCLTGGDLVSELRAAVSQPAACFPAWLLHPAPSLCSPLPSTEPVSWVRRQNSEYPLSFKIP